MHIVEITALTNGAHRNQTWDDAETIPAGFVAVPDSLLEAWSAAAPFADLTIEDGVLTGITARDTPAETETTAAPPTLEERVAAMEAYQLEQVLEGLV